MYYEKCIEHRILCLTRRKARVAATAEQLWFCFIVVAGFHTTKSNEMESEMLCSHRIELKMWVENVKNIIQKVCKTYQGTGMDWILELRSIRNFVITMDWNNSSIKIYLICFCTFDSIFVLDFDSRLFDRHRTHVCVCWLAGNLDGVTLQSYTSWQKRNEIEVENEQCVCCVWDSSIPSVDS